MTKMIVKAVVGLSALSFVGWLAGTGISKWMLEE